jgi:hypothetical protein
VTVASGGSIDRDLLVGRLVDALKVTDAEAHARIAELVGAKLLRDRARDVSAVEVTDAGLQLHGRIRATVTEITERMWGDLPADDLATAGRVLNTILARANAELGGA